MQVEPSGVNQPMRLYPLTDAWGPRDDWTGITSSVERKKRQNRINQRAFRRRKHAPSVEPQSTPTSYRNAVSPSAREHVAGHIEDDAPETPEPQEPSHDSGLMHGGPVLLTCPRRIAQRRALIRHAYQEYSLHAARPTNLPIIIRLNVLNALARNAVLMGFPPEGLCRDEMISPYTEKGPPTLAMQTSCPKALEPTQLQRTLPHHPWIDLFPFPAFRDNMLLAIHAGIFDEDELCMDLLNVEAEDIGVKPALIVWGDSSDVCGWEANVPFLRKWGWLVKSCPEIIEGSNYWREKRGEKKLVIEAP
ncbi:hypothetical protein P153DRAFT_374191 [Dothidotthia symphoricarpi CBS 119687]|uniref:BZIP domain-containing protein n=1 Tax=Dothidotthia symphoricarpi CBS 119687 TaxID=1392245 RepID=A0A6A6AGZ0_9PLEO|nr:uncharacterized protein P153DRAFT_374191 [Dothidotthia symphoricarpi CBS 119687]KAF2131252.1 hypothetical protein P153DRAFT_374191 [Dothidotthia symphoricarpi CBS 119687]